MFLATIQFGISKTKSRCKKILFLCRVYSDRSFAVPQDRSRGRASLYFLGSWLWKGIIISFFMFDFFLCLRTAIVCGRRAVDRRTMIVVAEKTIMQWKMIDMTELMAKTCVKSFSSVGESHSAQFPEVFTFSNFEELPRQNYPLSGLSCCGSSSKTTIIAKSYLHSK